MQKELSDLCSAHCRLCAYLGLPERKICVMGSTEVASESPDISRRFAVDEATSGQIACKQTKSLNDGLLALSAGLGAVLSG